MSADDALLSELRGCVADEFHVARPMPGNVYHSDSFAALERERIFHHGWICLGRVSDFAREGSFVTETIGGVSVLAVRQSDGAIKAFLNACAHRFARLVDAREGARKLFVCPYHAWAYDGAGALVRAPFMEASGGFEPETVSLRELHTDVWQGFLYVSLAAEPPRPASERLERITSEVIAPYRMEHYETVIQDEMPVAANWKNMIENFIESYHIFAVHAATFGTSGKNPDAYICGPDMDHCAFHWGVQTEGRRHGCSARLERLAHRRVAAHHGCGLCLPLPFDHARTGLHVVCNSSSRCVRRDEGKLVRVRGSGGLGERRNGRAGCLDFKPAQLHGCGQ